MAPGQPHYYIYPTAAQEGCMQADCLALAVGRGPDGHG